MESDEERNRKLYQQYEKVAPWDTVWNATVAVIILHGTRLAVQGTGTLLKIAEEHFLVTAEHVLRPGNLAILPTNTSKMIDLKGEGIFGENVDIGVVRISPIEAAKIDAGRFLRLDHFSEETGGENSLYVVVGFPECLFNADEPTITRYHQIAHGWEGDPTHLEEYDELYHFHIGANIDEMIDPNGKPMDFVYRDSNVPAQFPKDLKGISGGAVWRIAEFKVDRHYVVPPKIVGVECAVFQTSRCIRAIRWGAVKDMIRKAFPDDVRPAMDLWRP